jgi:hypothetical protein
VTTESLRAIHAIPTALQIATYPNDCPLSIHDPSPVASRLKGHGTRIRLSVVESAFHESNEPQRGGVSIGAHMRSGSRPRMS